MEALVRFGVFIGVLGLMILWETLQPTRQTRQARRRRWPVNLGLAALNVASLRVSIGAAAWLAAQWVAGHGWGLFNVLKVADGLAVAGSLVLLDLAIYAQHVAAHRWRWLWRLHQVHHSDPDFDTTTAVRFHPLEILLSMLYKVAVVVALGAPPVAVMAFEIILSTCALFNHGNVSLPPALERPLRWLLVTPDMHRIHHSARPAETDSNYGFSLSCWDRCFRTYCAAPQEPQSAMQIGLPGFTDPSGLGFAALLRMPFQPLRRRS